VTVPTLDGQVHVRVATGTNTGDKMTLAGMGMRKLNGKRGSGDLKVEFRVAMPKYLNTNQRTILELLADEMGDTTAKRVVHPNKPKPESVESDHKNEGFLKSVWHNLTNAHQAKAQDESSDPSESKPEEAKDKKDTEAEDEPKKASDPGSA